MLKTLLALIMMALMTMPAYTQFKKFQSQAQYDTDDSDSDSDETSMATSLLDNAEELDQGSEDVFGRGNSVRPNTPIKKDNKYVNLNPDTAFGPEVVESFDFPNTTLIDLTKHMQKLTGINLILDKDLKGKVSIMAPTAITVGDAWKAYLTALNTNGYTLVKSGAFYKIVNARDIRYTPTKIYTGTYTPDTENYAMRILPLKNIDSTEVTRSFRPFMSRYGRIIDIKQTNTIIVQDTGTNINRLVRLIRFIDVPGHEESLQIIKMKYSSAQEIAKLLDQILKSNTGTRFKNAPPSGNKSDANNISKIIAEPRTNSIIAMANAEGSKQLRALIAKLDVQSVASSGGQIHVYYLNHGDAEALSKTLSTLVSGASSGSGGPTSNFSKTRIPGQESNSLFGSDVKITADKDNNAVVVTASPTDYLTIKEVIKKLDIPRDQVYVEGLMMETQVSKNRGFGISIVGAYGTGGTDKAGFTGGSNDLMNLISNNITSLGGLFVGGGAGSKVTQNIGGQEIEIKTVNGLISAIANSGNSNVLATPQILALDNTEAVFEVGETVPTPERTNAANGSSTVSMKQQKVALTLKITPQINKVTRFVKLKIDQKIEDFSNRSLPDGVASDGIATTTRSAVTTVVVRDKDTVAMGGLMRDKENFTENKIPLLGDIPVLGWLFKNTRKGVEKVNLLFFLTPKIIASYEKASAETVKDVLNRRNTHLKNIQGEDDPFGTTVKGLYEKAQKQEEGPLYDVDEASRYLKQNEGPGVTGGINDDLLGASDKSIDDIPDYKQIVEKIKSTQSALKKEGHPEDSE